MTHTPGPWTVADGSRPVITGDCLLRPQIWSKGPRIAFCEEQNVGGIVAEANARLIAAAPDLLEALVNLVRINEEWNSAVEGVIGRSAGWNADYLSEAKAAIAKAESQ